MQTLWPSSKEIEELNKFFGFSATGDEQDWEIEFADHNRIQEFVSAYEKDGFSPSQRMAVMSLALASFDDLLMCDREDEQLWKRIAAHLERDRALHEYNIEHWSCGESESPDEMFELTPRMRTLTKNAS